VHRGLLSHHAEDAVADREAVDAQAERLDRPGDVAAEDRRELVRHVVLHRPSGDEQVEGVHRGGGHADQDLAGTGNGVVHNDHRGWRVERGQGERFHRWLLFACCSAEPCDRRSLFPDPMASAGAYRRCLPAAEATR
jgi:hypothetical protein